LLESVLDPPDTIGHERESWAIENCLLDAGNETQAEVLTDLTDLAQEIEVENQLLVLACPEVVEQLIHYQKEPVVGILLVECTHHLLETALAVGDLIRGRKRIGNAHGG
jgi:hypothetical protein